MSGYLHRLAASAIRPQPRVHPLVESIYPAVRREEAPGFVFHTEASAAPAPVAGAFSPVMQAAQPAVRVSPSESTGQGRLREAEAPVSHPDSRPARSAATHSSLSQAALQPDKGELPVEAISANSEAFQPLLSQLAMRQQEAEAARPAAARDSESAAEPSARPASPTSSSTSAAASASESSRSATATLRPWTFESIVESITTERTRPAPVFPARAASRQAPASISPARRAASLQPEDIQIHIGRIEVTAVPPQAPQRAMPAPARKGPTLDEYLRGSNGRAR